MSRVERYYRRVLGALGVLAVSLPCSARPPGALDLRWTAPDGCPSPEAVEARVRELTGTAPARSLPAEGVIERAQERFRLTLVIRDGASVSERVLESASCADLGGAAAVALALLLRGGETERPPPASPPVERSEASSVAPDALEVRFGLRAPLVTLEVGPLPRPSAGLSAGAALLLDAWSLVALGQWSVQQRLSSEAFPGYGAVVSRIGGSLWACRGFGDGRLEVAPCAALWLTHLRARGTGADLSRIRSQRFTWASPAVGLAGRFRLGDFLGVVVSASGRVETARPRFSVAGLGEIHRLGPAALALGAGTEWNF